MSELISLLYVLSKKFEMMMLMLIMYYSKQHLTLFFKFIFG